MGWNHNYIFTQGYFYCTKCGHRKYGKTHNKNRSAKIGAGIAIVLVAIAIGFLFTSGIIEFNQENLDESLQSIPEELIKAGETATNLASETNAILRESISEQIENVQVEPVERIVSDIQQIPKYVPGNDPLSDKPEIDNFELEKQVHKITNQYRIQNGLASLSWDDNLAKIARSHSQDMAKRNYFDHETPEGAGPTDRATSFGYTCEQLVGNLIYYGIGENIFQNNLYDRTWYTGGVLTSYEWNSQEEIAQSTVDGWMNSSGHRENILRDMHEKEGIGIEISDDHKVYITQNFC